MSKEFTFKKENDGWFVVLTEWKGDKSELEMVAGADDMLDKLSKGNKDVSLIISEVPILNHDAMLTFLNKKCGGGNYSCLINEDVFEVWLCHVTIFIYGYLPRMLYIKINE